jgi:hypothetical protein
MRRVLHVFFVLSHPHPHLTYFYPILSFPARKEGTSKERIFDSYSPTENPEEPYLYRTYCP